MINRLTIWISGQILYAKDLNAEFSNITNQVLPGPGVFSVSGNLYKPVGIQNAPVNLIAWMASLPCTAIAMKARVIDGTNAIINAMHNGSSNLLASNATVTPAEGWIDLGTLQNQSFAFCDTLAFILISKVGTVTQVFWQVTFTNP